MATLVEVTKLLTWLAALYPHYNLTTPGIQAYHGVLGDVSAEILELAVRHLASQGRDWFPPAGVIRNAAFELMEDDAPPSAMEAWGEVERSFSYPPDKVQWSHSLVKQALDAMGGRHVIGMAPLDSAMSDRARFCEVYKTLLRRARDDQRMLPEVRQGVEQLKAGGEVEAEILRLADGFRV